MTTLSLINVFAQEVYHGMFHFRLSLWWKSHNERCSSSTVRDSAQTFSAFMRTAENSECEPFAGITLWKVNSS